MSWDIYGERLQPGHCECHPCVHEPWPCHLCYIENDRAQAMREEQERQNADMEAEYNQRLREDYELDVLRFDRLAMGM